MESNSLQNLEKEKMLEQQIVQLKSEIAQLKKFGA
jgi:hypothetical protein